MTDALKPIEKVNLSIEVAKEKLKSTDDGLRKLTGRDPMENRFGRRLGPPSDMKYNNNQQPKRGHREHDDMSPSPKRPTLMSQISFGSKISIVKRTEGRRVIAVDEENDEDIDSRTVLTSAVSRVADKTRKDAIEDLKRGSDNKEQERGRRMLGVLLGTLQKFKSEADKQKSTKVERHRQQVEHKIETKKAEEKQEIFRETMDLYKERKEKQTQLRLLQRKKSEAHAFELWRGEVLKTKTHIRTIKKPYIFYKPKVMDDESQRRLDSSSKAIDEMIDERRQSLDKAIESIAETLSKPREEKKTGNGKNNVSPRRASDRSSSSSSSSSDAPSDKDTSQSEDEPELADISFSIDSEQVPDHNTSVVSVPAANPLVSIKSSPQVSTPSVTQPHTLPQTPVKTSSQVEVKDEVEIIVKPMTIPGTPTSQPPLSSSSKPETS